MVNETNKPQQCPENEQLGQRLTASNQALVEMQAEHRRLMEEMEQLRRRAEELQRLRDQQHREGEAKRQQNMDISESPNKDSQPNVKNKEGEKESDEETKINPEEAEYIKDKLAEVARLKAQLKRVQRMVNTTELIENHLTKNQSISDEAQETETAKPKTHTELNTKQETNVTIPATTTVLPATSVTTENLTMPEMPNITNLNAASTSDEKEQLLETMLNMFQDFSSDLKSQADNLRAERERIKELKESIIRSKKGASK